MTPVAYGGGVLIFLSLIYEPVRLLLDYVLVDWSEVGGVGGVGGLTNQWFCPPITAPNRTTNYSNAPYCFHRGVLLGLTPFAIVIVIFWSLLPLFIPVLWLSLGQKANGKSCTDRPCFCQCRIPFPALWLTASCVWFFIPLVDYLQSPFYHSSWTRVVLGVCISAALPLSWHLAFVAIPVSAPILAPLVGPWRKRQDLARYHKFVAWSTLGWAGIHAGGELIYLLFDTSSSSFLESIDLSDGEHLLFVAGLATAMALIVHAVIAAFRKQCLCHNFNTFRSVHRALAAVVLVFATTHWWPFVFFLAPTVATHAASTASRVCVSTDRKTLSRQTAARMLTAALVCNLLGVVGLWQVRQWYMEMLQPRVMYYVAFVFPPLTLVVGFISAWVGSLLSKILCRDNGTSLEGKDVDVEEERQRPLLRGNGVE